MSATMASFNNNQTTSTDRTEIRAVIKFCNDLGKTPTETYSMIKEAKGECSVSRTLVFKWHRRYCEGREGFEDDSRSGRRTSVGGKQLTSIEDALASDRRLTVRELSDISGLSVGTVHSFITKEMRMRKVHARWVPRLLKDYEKERQVEESEKFLSQHRCLGDAFLESVITTDETWLFLHDPETKEQSAVWQRSGSPPPVKGRVSRSARKQMYVMFADSRGMILCHAVPPNTNINADYYSKVLRRDLVSALRKKRPGIPIESFQLHQDNAPPHTAASTMLEIGILGFKLMTHPPYSPDLAPFDYAIFPQIKSVLKGQRFETLRELQTETNSIIRRIPAEWFHDVIVRQWIHRHQRSVECSGRYFEKA